MAAAELVGIARSGVSQPLLYAFQTELQVFNLAVFALCLDHAARNQQQNRTFGHSDVGASLVACENKPKRQSGGTQFENARAIPQKPGRVSGIGVAKRAQFLVVTTDECGARADTSRPPP